MGPMFHTLRLIRLHRGIILLRRISRAGLDQVMELMVHLSRLTRLHEDIIPHRVMWLGLERAIVSMVHLSRLTRLLQGVIPHRVMRVGVEWAIVPMVRASPPTRHHRGVILPRIAWAELHQVMELLAYTPQPRKARPAIIMCLQVHLSQQRQVMEHL